MRASLLVGSLLIAALPTASASAQAVSTPRNQVQPLPSSPAPATPFLAKEKLPPLSHATSDAEAGLTSEERCEQEAKRQLPTFQASPVGTALKMYLSQVSHIVQVNWKPLMPKEVDKPFYKEGEVKVCFAILPSGQVEPKSMVLLAKSGDPALDRAAAGAVETSVYPRLPEEFAGPRITMLFYFEYNKDRRPNPVKNMAKPPNPFGPVAVTVGYTSKL